jgi:hypothetical protein
MDYFCQLNGSINADVKISSIKERRTAYDGYAENGQA